MSYCMPPECDGIPNPVRHAIEPDWVASECDDQLPAFSKIGRGPRGKGVYTEIEKTKDGQVIIHFKDDETGEEIGDTGDISAGRISVSYAPKNPVAGDEVKMFVSVRSGSNVSNYVVPVPSGAYGSRIYLLPEPVVRNSDDTYQCSVDDLTIYGLQRWESKPEPRPNDVLLFNYEDSEGHGFAFGTIEAVERGQVVYTARVFNTLPSVSILPDGTWAVDGESTGIKAQGPKGEDAKIKVRREGNKAVITATDSDGETTAEVLDGKDGQNAKLTVQRVENGAKLTATDADGVTTATVKDGSDGEDGSDGLPAMLTLGSVQETSQPQVTLVPGRVQKNEYIISFGLPRGADGKSIDINGGVYRVDQLPDFDETPVNDAFIVLDDDERFDLYIRGKEPVIAEEGGPWTVVEDWQGVNGYSMRMLEGRSISTEEVLRIPVGEAETAFVPHKGLRDGDLVFDDNGTIGIVGSAMDDSGDYTVSYVAKLNVHWDNIDGKPEDLLQTSDIIQGDNIKVEADAQAGTVKISTDIKDGAITGDMLALDSIDTSKIIDGAVTADKIAEGVIPPEYVLPVATEDVLGGIKSDGETVSIAEDGKLSVVEKPLAKQVCGNVVSVNDASAQKPLGLKVKGVTRQNLWVNPSGALNGITLTANANGSITLSGEQTDVADFQNTAAYSLKPGTTYTISVDKNPFSSVVDDGAIYIHEVKKDGSYGKDFSIGYDGFQTKTFTTSTGDDFDHVECRLVFRANGTYTPGTYRVMLNEGAVAEPWCPPGLNGVNSLRIPITTGNLISPIANNATTQGVTVTVDASTQMFSVHGTNTGSAIGIGYLAAKVNEIASLNTAISSGKYKLISNIKSTYPVYIQVNATLLDGSGIASVARVGDDSESGQVIKIPEGYRLYNIFLGIATHATANYDGLWAAVVPVDYPDDEHILWGSSTIEIDLNGNELRSLPDGTCDELRIDADGEATLTKRVGYIELNGSQSFSWQRSINSGWLQLNDIARMNDYSQSMLCDKLPVKTHNESETDWPQSITGYKAPVTTFPGQNWVYARTPSATNAAQIKAWFASNSTLLLYQLAKSQTISLGKVDLPVLPSPIANVWAVATDGHGNTFTLQPEICVDYITDRGDALSSFMRKGSIEAGSNVSISESDDGTLTISATGGGGGGGDVDTATDEDFQAYIGY